MLVRVVLPSVSLTHAQVVMALCGHLRQVGDAEHLAAVAQRPQLRPTISAMAPPMPASTSSNTMHARLVGDAGHLHGE